MPARLLTCLCLLTLLTGCGVPRLVVVPPDAPPANLATPCWAGPDYPAGDVLLGELLDVMAQREAAAADCRDRHAGLVRAWPASR